MVGKRNVSILLAVLMVLATASVPVWATESPASSAIHGTAIAWDVVNLSWEPVSGAIAYQIYRSTSPDDLMSPSNLLVVVNWSDYPKYEPGKTYVQGDTVEYEGKIWRAKYWTQSAPGSDAWELVGNATPATHYLDQYNLHANTTYYYTVVPVLSDGSLGSSLGTLEVTTPERPYRVVVYYISWARYNRKFYVSDIPWENVTDVLYAFLKPNENGSVTLYDTYADPLNLEQMKEYKRKYPAVKVLVSVGGWTLSTYFSDIAADPAKRLTFARSVLKIIREYDLDGVDIDWEYPGGGGLSSNHVSPDDGKNFVLLLKTIREVFDNASRQDHKNYLISVAAPADPEIASRINWTEASKYLDFIDLMTYDYHGAWDNVTGFLAPLYADPSAPYTDPVIKWEFNVNYTVNWYLHHVPNSTKVVLGLPFYGRSFANVPPTNNGLYQPFSGTPAGTWGPASETYGVMDYWDIAGRIANGTCEAFWSNVTMEPYAYCPSSKVFITYDNPRSIGIKVDYMLEHRLGGVMVWEITADRKPGTSSHPLLATILEHLREKPPAWLPDTYYLGSSVPANLSVPLPSYNGTPASNETAPVNSTNQTAPSPANTTVQNPVNSTANSTGTTGTANVTNSTANSTLLRPGAISVKVTDWGDTEYDVTLNLNGTYDWELWVKLSDGSTVKSLWSANERDENGWVVFTPVSWNRGPTASFGFIASGSKPVEEMVLKVNGQVWDVWPEGSSVPANGSSGVSSGTSNETAPAPSNGTATPSNSTPTNTTAGASNATNATASNSTVLKPGAISVNVNDWGNTEYDVTLDLGGQYDWTVRVKLRDGSSISSYWSVSKAEENGWVVFTPASWNKGPTASFGFIATGSKPVEEMVLEVNGEIWDVWPEGSSVPSTGSAENGTSSSNSTSTPSSGSNVTVGTNVTYVPAGPGLPEHFFAPYIDMTLTDVHKPLVEYYNLTGTPYFTLAFVLYGSAQNGPSWGGKLPLDYYVNEVSELRKAGGDVIISFGGAVGPYLCQQAKTPEQLADWYLQVIDTYNATYLDFDIESSINVTLLADALLLVQREVPGIKVSFTLPSDPGAGLVGNGYSIIQTMVQKGVRIDRVNAMTMDYYWTPSNANNSIKVAEHLFTQLQNLYPNRTDDEIWGMIGLTPMIGVNDDHSVFTLDDARELVEWAIQHRIRSLAFWSVDRDHPGPEGQVSPTNSGTSNPNWAYSHVFVQFMTAFTGGSTAPASTPVPA